MSSSSKPTTANPPNHPPFSPTYSHISTVTFSPGSKLISFAGQIGYDPEAQKIPQDYASQVSLALSHVGKCLATAGATKEDIVQVRQYVVGMSKHGTEERKARVEAYTSFMGDCKPPSTLIGVESLATPELLYEIEVAAVVHG